MTEWQTKIDTYSGFPQCCQYYQEMNDHVGNAYGNQTAFFCKLNGDSMKILESECRGMKCPVCKLVGFDKYTEMMKQ